MSLTWTIALLGLYVIIASAVWAAVMTNLDPDPLDPQFNRGDFWLAVGGGVAWPIFIPVCLGTMLYFYLRTLLPPGASRP